MYQLLIVDDETSVVDSLAVAIQWDEFGVTEVHRAYSANEALQIAASHPIDILITDVQMPETDGLELIRRIRTMSRKIRSIILSGHDNFEYAKRAIHYQTVDYLLKPVDLEALMKSVESGIQQIEAEWEEFVSLQEIKHTLHANLPLLKNQLLNDLLHNKPIVPDVLEERLRMLGLSIELNDPYMMLVIRLEEEFSGYDLKSLALLEYAVCNICEEVFRDVYEVWYCTTEQGYLVLILKSNEAGALNQVDSYAIKVQNHVQKLLKGSLSICLSDIAVFPNFLATQYTSSVSAINRNIGKNQSYFITIKDSRLPTQNQQSNKLYEPPLLYPLIESGDWDEAHAKVRRILSIGDDNAPLTQDYLFMAFLYLSSSFSGFLTSEKNTVEDQLGEEFDLLLRRKSQISKQRIFEWAIKMMDKIKAKSSNQLDNSHQLIASKVRMYIQDQLSKGISLQDVADYVNLHPVYLSKVYKTVTGETIGDYIYRIRMERAAHLLLHTDLKIAEVSNQLGFLSPQYFIKIFKKHYGSTPLEFRTR